MEVGLGLTAMTKVVKTRKYLLLRHTHKPYSDLIMGPQFVTED